MAGLAEALEVIICRENNYETAPKDEGLVYDGGIIGGEVSQRFFGQVAAVHTIPVGPLV